MLLASGDLPSGGLGRAGEDAKAHAENGNEADNVLGELHDDKY